MKGAADVAVIGAGLGGLSAAAALARTGKRVLVVERSEGPGGNAHAFHRGPYCIDPAVHLTAHGYHVEFLDVYLEALGVSGGLELAVLDEMFSVDIAGERFALPTGEEAVTEYLSERFPAARDGIRRYIEVCAQATIESQAPPRRVALKDLDALMAALPTLFRYRNATLGDVLEEFVEDPQARAVLGAQWPYMGLPPSQVSFMALTAAFMSFMNPGPVYVMGSFQQLADALAAVVLEQGGEILYGIEVTGIEVSAGRATGIRLDDGRTFGAEVVISNADARLTFEQLVGPEHLPAQFMNRLRRMQPSISAFMILSACTLPVHELGVGPEMFVYDGWDHDASWAALSAGGLGGTWLTVPTLIDPSLAPEGEHLVLFTGLMPRDVGEPWAQARERLAEAMVERVETLLPGYRNSITFLENATPETFERYTRAQDGALYGWANLPRQTQPKRLPHVTPIEGLLLAGHWTNPGSGSLRCLLSGVQAAATVTGEHDPIALLGSLR